MTEQLADHGQALAERQGSAGKGVAEVMDPHVVEFGPRPDAPAGVLKVGQVAARFTVGQLVSCSARGGNASYRTACTLR